MRKEYFGTAGAHDIDRCTNTETPDSMAKIENFVEPVLSVRSAGKAMTLTGLWWLTRDAFFQWIDDNPFQMGAALAYYTLF